MRGALPIGRSLRAALVMGVVAVIGSGCVSSQRDVVYDRDEPEQRLASMVDGVVVRVDAPQRVVVLDNGQMYRVSGERAVAVNGRPVVLGGLQPGTRVAILSGTPVVYRNGQYVEVTRAPATATVSTPGGGATVPAPPVVPAPPAGTVITTPPAGTVVTAPIGTAVALPGSAGNPIRMQGRVADIEGNGNVKVRLPDGNAFEFRPPAGTIARKDDLVTIDMVFGAAVPSALPR